MILRAAGINLMLTYKLQLLMERLLFSYFRLTYRMRVIRRRLRNMRIWLASSRGGVGMPISHESRFPPCQFCGKPELPPGIVLLTYGAMSESPYCQGHDERVC